MPKEIERKFLVDTSKLGDILHRAEYEKLWQYYLVATKDLAIRLRTRGASYNETVLTIKHGASGISVNEEEFHVSYSSYLARFHDRIGREIVKCRYFIPYNGRTWVVDVFEEDLAGLIIAELECDDAAEVVDLPPWVSTEVTSDYRYKNAVLTTSDEWKKG